MRSLLLCAVGIFAAVQLFAQEEDPRQLILPGLHKLSGVEPTQKITYSRIFLDGQMVPPGSPAGVEQTLPISDGRPPVLIAQCTKSANGKMKFDLFANFGSVSDFTYHPPWKSSGPDDPFPPRMLKTSVTFDFFGYTKVKPVKRRWEMQLDPIGEMRYDSPSAGSTNMEEISFYLQYLKALPTLRLTQGTHAAQFKTDVWLKAIHDEPLCWASGV